MVGSGQGRMTLAAPGDRAPLRHEELEALYATAGQLTERLEVDAVLATVVRRARELLASDIAYIMLTDRAAGALVLRVSVGHRTKGFVTIVRPVTTGMVAADRRPLSSADFLNDSRLHHHAETDHLLRAEGIRSILAVPLERGPNMLGGLYVANRYVHAFTDHEVNLLSSLGEHASLALENARLYEEAVASAAAAVAAHAEAEARLHRLQRAEEVHRGLTEVLLAGGGVAGVTASLASALGLPIVVTDWRRAVLAQVGADALLDRGGQLARSFLGRPAVRDALQACADDYATASIEPDWMVSPITARREIMGHIWARVRPSAQAAELVRTSLEQAARVVALELLRERAAEEIERRLRRDFVYELLSARPVPAALAARARQAWSGHGLAHRPAVLHVDAPIPAGDVPLERARRLLSTISPPSLVAIYGNHLVLLLPAVDREDVDEQLGRMRALLQREGLRLGAVVGAASTDLMRTRESIQAALRLLELLGPRPLVWAEGLEALTLLFGPGDGERLRAFLASALAPLADRPALLRTLDAYYEAGGNRAAAGRLLRLHVNTVRQRVDRAEEALGWPVDDPVRSASLRLALLVRRAIE
jgi:GAF domain-containing protein/sugar diacid utilization regulator